PRERLLFEELDQLTREFIETSLVAAGVEWFRQRVAAGPEAGGFQKLGGGGGLHEKGRGLGPRLGFPAPRRPGPPHPPHRGPRKNAHPLRALWAWAQRRGFREAGRRVLRQSWSETSFSESDARLWAERLGAPPADRRESAPLEDGGSVAGGLEPAAPAAPLR